MAKKGGKKSIQRQNRRDVVKRLSPGEPPKEHLDGHPSWRFETMDFGFPSSGNWSSMAGAELEEIVQTLTHCEKQPMSAIFQGRGNTRGGVTLYDAATIESGLTRDARARLHDINLGDLDELVRIRAGSLPRIYAWRGNGNVFNLIWWDPNHDVYPTER